MVIKGRKKNEAREEMGIFERDSWGLERVVKEKVVKHVYTAA